MNPSNCSTTYQNCEDRELLLPTNKSFLGLSNLVCSSLESRPWGRRPGKSIFFLQSTFSQNALFSFGNKTRSGRVKEFAVKRKVALILSDRLL
jgi:hypothetical protein